MFAGTADMSRLRHYDNSCDETVLHLQTLLLKTVQELHSRGCRRFICPIDEPFGLEAAHAVLMARETGDKACRNIVLQAIARCAEPHPELGTTARFLFEDILRSPECDSRFLSHEHAEEAVYRILEEELPQCAFLVCYADREHPLLQTLVRQAETAGIEVIRLDPMS